MTAPPLIVLLAAARAELEAETPMHIHTSHASKTEDADGHVDADEGGIGLPFTEEFHRLLAMRSQPRQTEYLMRASLNEVTDWCRIQHPNHDADGVYLCGEVISLAVRWSWGTEQISYHVLYPEPVVRSILIGGLQHAANWRQGRLRARPKTAADLVIESDARRHTRRARMYDNRMGTPAPTRATTGG